MKARYTAAINSVFPGPARSPSTMGFSGNDHHKSRPWLSRCENKTCSAGGRRIKTEGGPGDCRTDLPDQKGQITHFQPTNQVLGQGSYPATHPIPLGAKSEEAWPRPISCDGYADPGKPFCASAGNIHVCAAKSLTSSTSDTAGSHQAGENIRDLSCAVLTQNTRSKQQRITVDGVQPADGPNRAGRRSTLAPKYRSRVNSQGVSRHRCCPCKLRAAAADQRNHTDAENHERTG